MRRCEPCSAQLSAARPGQQYAAHSIDPGYLAVLLRACGQADAVPPPRRTVAAPPGLVEPLTDRELEVLRLLAAGRSNQRIAYDLVVALDTVPKYVTHTWKSSAPPTAARPPTGPASSA